MRTPRPFSTPRRNDSKTFQVTLNHTCGLPERVCAEWRRRSFLDLPDELAQYRNPKTKSAAEAGAVALVAYLKRKLEEGAAAHRVRVEDITVGAWIEKFTTIETSPRAGANAARNRPYSPDTVETYRGYYTTHIKGDPFTLLKMAEVEEEDTTEYITRLSAKRIDTRKNKIGRPMGGTRTFAGVVIFIRMAFREYQKKNRKWSNPFQYTNPPLVNGKTRRQGESIYFWVQEGGKGTDKKSFDQNMTKISRGGNHGYHRSGYHPHERKSCRHTGPPAGMGELVY